MPATYTSTARVLVNPTVGNPFTPTPASVRQDQETSLATEAQVARSAEVLSAVLVPGLALEGLERRVRVNVPANTQILEISFTAGDPVVAQRVVDAVAAAYLANRERRFGDVTDARIERLENQTVRVVDDLRQATDGRPARQRGQAHVQQPAGRRAQERAGEPSRAAHGTGEPRSPGRHRHLPRHERRPRRDHHPGPDARRGRSRRARARVPGRAAARTLDRQGALGRRGRGDRSAGAGRSSHNRAGRSATCPLEAARGSRRRSAGCGPRCSTNIPDPAWSRSLPSASAGRTTWCPRRWRSPSPGPAIGWCWSGRTASRPPAAWPSSTTAWPRCCSTSASACRTCCSPAWSRC